MMAFLRSTLKFLTQLGQYETIWPDEVEIVRRFKEFIENQPRCFERNLTMGHVTASALMLSQNLSKVLLTHHRKLNIWIQLGGHCDGHPIPHEVALREAREESGFNNVEFYPYEKSHGTEVFHPLMFDLDIHRIPAFEEEPKHLHYDVRYLLITTQESHRARPEESKELRWFPLSEGYQVTSELSMHRQLDKLRVLLNK